MNPLIMFSRARCGVDYILEILMKSSLLSSPYVDIHACAHVLSLSLPHPDALMPDLMVNASCCICNDGKHHQALNLDALFVDGVCEFFRSAIYSR